MASGSQIFLSVAASHDPKIVVVTVTRRGKRLNAGKPIQLAMLVGCYARVPGAWSATTAHKNL